MRELDGEGAIRVRVRVRVRVRMRELDGEGVHLTRAKPDPNPILNPDPKTWMLSTPGEDEPATKDTTLAWAPLEVGLRELGLES